MGKDKSKSGKLTALITYVIALVCLLAGLLIPLGVQDGFNISNMLAWQLPKAINALFNKDWIKFGADFTYSLPINFFGLLKDGKTFDIGALMALLYGVITVAGVVALVPVIITKKARTAVKAASFIEVLAVAALAVMVFIRMEAYMTIKVLADSLGASMEGFHFGYALLIAFGGTLLMLIVQAFAYKGASGFAKFLLFLLSAVAVMFAVFPVATFIPMFGDWFGGKLATGLYGAGSEGIYPLIIAFNSNFFTALDGLDMKLKILMIAGLIVGFLVIANFMLDMMGLGKRTNGGMLISNLVRYVLEIVAVILMVVMAFLVDGYKVEILGYALAVIAVLQLVINIIRLVKYKARKGAKKVKKAKKEKKVKEPKQAVVATPVVVTETDTKQPEVVDKKAEKRAAKEAAKAEKEAEKAAAVEAKEAAKAEKEAAKAEKIAATAKPAEATAPEVYKVEPLYDGPIDDFIRKLNNSDRIEFAQVFLERSKGNLTNIPEYVVGGKNDKFFASVFIYYGRIRAFVSDSLMNKFYEEVNLM